MPLPCRDQEFQAQEPPEVGTLGPEPPEGRRGILRVGLHLSSLEWAFKWESAGG